MVSLLVPKIIKPSNEKKEAKRQEDLMEKLEIPKDLFDIINYLVLEEPRVPEIVENSINYVMNKIMWNQNECYVEPR